MSYYDGFPSYTPQSVRKERNERKIKIMLKEEPDLKPVIIEGRNIAKTWWGKAWNNNLEIYADYSNRLARGRSYIRTGAIFDLKIETGVVNALVQGSRPNPYEVTVEIAPLDHELLEKIGELCQDNIKDLEELLHGKFPKELMQIFTLEEEGLFPRNEDIKFACTCPDWAYMCKHVVAVLYGIGNRFDQDPTLFFKLRNIDFSYLISKTIEQKMDNMLKNANKPSKRILEDKDISELFGL